jgi:hypothetical protein
MVGLEPEALARFFCVILSAAKNPGVSECGQVHPNRVLSDVFGALIRQLRSRRGWGASASIQKDPGFFAALRMTQGGCAQNGTRSE